MKKTPPNPCPLLLRLQGLTSYLLHTDLLFMKRFVVSPWFGTRYDCFFRYPDIVRIEPGPENQHIVEVEGIKCKNDAGKASGNENDGTYKKQFFEDIASGDGMCPLPDDVQNEHHEKWQCADISCSHQSFDIGIMQVHAAFVESFLTNKDERSRSGCQPIAQPRNVSE